MAKNKEYKTSDNVFVKITIEYANNTKQVLLFDDKEFAEQKYNEFVEQLKKEKVCRSFIDSSLYLNNVRAVQFELLPGFSNHMLVLVDTTSK